MEKKKKTSRFLDTRIHHPMTLTKLNSAYVN